MLGSCWSTSGGSLHRMFCCQLGPRSPAACWLALLTHYLTLIAVRWTLPENGSMYFSFHRSSFCRFQDPISFIECLKIAHVLVVVLSSYHTSFKLLSKYWHFNLLPEMPLRSSDEELQVKTYWTSAHKRRFHLMQTISAIGVTSIRSGRSERTSFYRWEPNRTHINGCVRGNLSFWSRISSAPKWFWTLELETNDNLSVHSINPVFNSSLSPVPCQTKLLTISYPVSRKFTISPPTISTGLLTFFFFIVSLPFYASGPSTPSHLDSPFFGTIALLIPQRWPHYGK